MVFRDRIRSDRHKQNHSRLFPNIKKCFFTLKVVTKQTATYSVSQPLFHALSVERAAL